MDRPIVTLLTDFGLSDAYVAQLKAAILSRVDAVELVDITHGVEPFGILQAGWLLGTTYGHFPRGSIHLCVVDPGVGTSRAALIVLKDGHAFVGPDNGVFSFIYPAEQVIEVTWRPSTPVSRTFHGRDLFAPVAAELLRKTRPESLGRPRSDPVTLDVSRDLIVHTDRFGNLVTNVSAFRWKEGSALVVGGTRIGRMAGTFEDAGTGEPALIVGSAGTLEIVL
ncbi:MAG: SAM-dependent chlorinase/fluorinase, partial [Desulfomonilia bacterium]